MSFRNRAACLSFPDQTKVHISLSLSLSIITQPSDPVRGTDQTSGTDAAAAESDAVTILISSPNCPIASNHFCETRRTNKLSSAHPSTLLALITCTCAPARHPASLHVIGWHFRRVRCTFAARNRQHHTSERSSQACTFIDISCQTGPTKSHSRRNSWPRSGLPYAWIEWILMGVLSSWYTRIPLT